VDASYRRTPVSKCVCTRQYPKVPRVDYGNGVKIVDKPVNKDRPVDIWPATITVKDAFKPGGLRMFEGKRNTDVVGMGTLLASKLLLAFKRARV
jgi:hypothetical protein